MVVMKLSFKRNPPKYELYYITWNGIGYDKNKLISFVKRYNKLKFLRFFSKSYKEEYQILNDILNGYDVSKLQLLLDNDENYSKFSILEKWARKASAEILLGGVYSNETYNVVSNLPVKDFKLFIKRTNELIAIHNNIAVQDENFTDGTPGL